MKNKIKIHRLMKNYSQAQLADLVGVSRQTINALEAEKYIPSTVLPLKISRVLQQPIELLFELARPHPISIINASYPISGTLISIRPL